ncbi:MULTISPECIES: ethylbenzene dehydrogenase-related protein [Vibrio]|uniref:ethylbenzene dehydrogenase-related protein n=1 Tax=Vibrio TaxID=662 RepID=UPI003D0B728D
MTEEQWQFLSPVLLQGDVYTWHFLSASCLSILSAVYATFKWRSYQHRRRDTHTPSRYHRLTRYYGITVLLLTILSGWLHYLDTALIQTSRLHLYSAIGIISYLVLHSWVYVIQLGKNSVHWLLPTPTRGLTLRLLSFTTSIIVLSLLLFYTLFFQPPFYKLNALEINNQSLFVVDGVKSETFWDNSPILKVQTTGGDNFQNGQTEISVQAAYNSEELIFYFTWQDPSHSLEHLPLVKTNGRWKVKQSQFDTFEESRFYEDKFAVMFSQSCEYGGDGSVKLGPKPLDHAPANWHGKGYHYTSGNLKDLWHWKAVRTNPMVQADDSYIGPALAPRPGQKRYTAGYYSDAKESGGYTMNWQWFQTEHIIPKRLPTASFSSAQSLTWFGSEPYTPQNDHYPEGTLLPSVILQSNQFEGDRGDVRAFATWNDGVWSLEMARKKQTGSQTDLPFHGTVCMWVAAFDQSQIGHTRHQKPIQLVLPL